MPSPRRTRRTLYSSPKTEDKTAFRWGIQSKHPSDVAISRGLRYYKSFTWENEHYEIGDHVLVAGEEDSQPYVAKLEELCDVSNSLSDMNYQGKVTWYARPDELKHKKLDRKLGKNEVVLLGGSGPKATSRLLDLETICGHCSVVVVSEEISSVAEEDEKGRQQYFCRYSLTSRSSLKPMKTSELKSLKKGDFYGYDASEFRDPIVQVEDIKATPQKSLKMKFKKTDKENFEIRTSPVKTPSRRALKAPDTVEKLAKNLDGVSLVNQRTPLRATRNGTTDILGTPKSSKAERTTTTRYGRSVRTLFSPEKVSKPLEKEAELSDGDLVNEDNDYNISTEDENDSSSSETSEGDSSSDDESNNRTGRKARASQAANKTPRSKAKIIAERRSAVTPSMPSRRAKAQQPQTDIERALSKLHVCAVPDQLPCREDQFAEIYDFVEGKLVDQVGSCMYISGVPGTGKTATVREVIRTLQDAQAAGDVPEFRFIEINGMKLSEPNQAYVQILRQLNGRKATADNAADILTEIFKSKRKSSDAMTILLVDELDLLWTRKQQVLYNIFDWPTHPNSRLVVVAIANTMDLPERMVMNKVASRMGLSRMTFQPYTFQELQEIVKARLTGLELMDPDAVQFISRKVAALSGDARRALDVCRRAVELSESGDGVQASPSKRAKKYAVTMMHVNKAVKEMFTSSKIVAMQALSFHEKLALRAIVAEFRRTGVEECVFHNVNSQYMTLARLEGVAPLRSSLLSRVLARMASSRLLILSDPKNDFQQKISLNATADDVNFALREQNDCDE